MRAAAIIGTTLAGTITGMFIGFWLGEREGGDFNFAPAIYAPVGATIGAVAGCVIGAVVFT